MLCGLIVVEFLILCLIFYIEARGQTGARIALSLGASFDVLLWPIRGFEPPLSLAGPVIVLTLATVGLWLRRANSTLAACLIGGTGVWQGFGLLLWFVRMALD